MIDTTIIQIQRAGAEVFQVAQAVFKVLPRGSPHAGADDRKTFLPTEKKFFGLPTALSYNADYIYILLFKKRK